MAEETDPEPQDVEWVSLTEAFNQIGRMKFNVKWDEGAIYLSKGRFRNGMCDEELPLRIDYSIRHNYPEEWREYCENLPHERPIASEEMLRHYDETEELLLDAIWEGKINVEAIASDGGISKVPRKAWKDKTKTFEISFPDSEVRRFKPEGSGETWRISVDPNDLKTLLENVNAERLKAIRHNAAKKNPKGGRPSKYNWLKLKLYIAEEMKNAAGGMSDSEIARRIEKRLEEEGIEAPNVNHLRGKVREVRESS